MKISFITLFPEFIDEFTKHSIIKKAIKNNVIEIEIINIRDFAKKEKNKAQVDDYIYGGGPGMLLLIEPIVLAIESIKTEKSHIILMGPKGKKFNQNKANNLKEYDHLIFVNGHYEGIDSRIKNFIDEEISVGDFIITGGELASMIISDSIIRLLPNVIKQDSKEMETFENNRLEYDQFSKPLDFRGHKVPEVLLSGNHKLIENWKKQNSIDNTINYILDIENKAKEK